LFVRTIAVNIGQLVVCMDCQLLYQVDQNYGNKEGIKAYANQLVTDQTSANTYRNDMVANITSLTSDYVATLESISATGSGGAIDCSQIDPQDTFQLCRTDADTGIKTCQEWNQITAYCNLQASQNITIEEQLLLLEQSGYDIDALQSLSNAEISLTNNQLVDTYYPAQKYMVEWPLMVGVVIACYSIFNFIYANCVLYKFSSWNHFKVAMR
jgi:hypothetical protein